MLDRCKVCVHGSLVTRVHGHAPVGSELEKKRSQGEMDEEIGMGACLKREWSRLKMDDTYKTSQAKRKLYPSNASTTRSVLFWSRVWIYRWVYSYIDTLRIKGNYSTQLNLTQLDSARLSLSYTC